MWGTFNKAALAASSFRGTYPLAAFRSSSKAGEIVKRSQPDTSLIYPALLNEAPIIMVLIP
jgi:hypothetical protein